MIGHPSVGEPRRRMSVTDKRVRPNPGIEREARSSCLTGSPQPLIAQRSDRQASRGECARSSAM